MGLPILKVNGFDFGPYLNLQHDAGLDPLNPENVVPEFSGSPAFREGKANVGDTADNRELTVPLVLDTNTRPELHALVKQINNLLVKGATVEFAIDSSVDKSSFFTLEYGRLDGQFEYYLSVNATTRATLHLWTSPFATTGTQRTIATVAGSGAAVITATMIDGDVAADAAFGFRVASQGGYSEPWGLVGYGLRYPVPSNFDPVIPVSIGAAGATTVGASGRLASQYQQFRMSPTLAEPQSIGGLTLGGHASIVATGGPKEGRFRMFIPVKHFMTNGVGGGNPSSALIFNSWEQTPTRMVMMATVGLPGIWNLVDAGEITIGKTYQALSMAYLGHPSVKNTGGSYPIALDQMIFLPVDQMAAVHYTDRTQFYGMDRVRFEFSRPSQTAYAYTSASAIGVGGASSIRDEIKYFRGDFPFLPPIPSGAASGPAAIVAFAGWRDRFTDFCALKWEADISVIERFQYLR